MRGKDSLSRYPLSLVGITPAYAGKSYSLALFLGLHRDHPRVCGEKPQARRPEPPPTGSPPRMRGKGRAHRVDA